MYTIFASLILGILIVKNQCVLICPKSIGDASPYLKLCGWLVVADA